MNAEKKWKREISAGGLVYKKDPPATPSRSAGGQGNGKIYILLIQPKGPNFGPPAGYWTFPKGLLDHAGENMEDVAIREVREEGGVVAEIKEPLGYVKFFRQSKDFGNALKFVHFWLMEYKSGDVADHDEEVAEAKWFELSEAESKLKFDHDKEVFERALEFLP